MADQHSEDVGSQDTNINSPATPRLADLELDEDFDESRDDPELQLTRSISHSEDPANTGGPDVDFLFDAELANLDPDDSTPTQSFFPPLPGLTPLSGLISLAGYHTKKYTGDDFDDEMTATSPARGGVSPSSSPRLPSPPPFTEVQIGPKSPSVADSNQNQLGEAARIDNGSTRRVRPGTKAAEMEKGPPLVPLNEVDSAFQAQEYLLALYHSFTRNPTTGFSHPITRDTAIKLATPPQIHGPESSTPFDRNLWLYELCRFLTIKANNIIVALFADTPPCSAVTCPEMRASEWQYLCAVHDPPKPCCAIDYCCHTLDWAGNVLSSPKYFSSRLTLGEGGNVAASMRHLTNIFRRVYRIFAHAWFQHRGVFWQVEGRDGVYIFFKTVCDVYQLIPEDNYTIPAEAESGSEEEHWETKTPVGMTNAEGSQQKMEIITKDNAVHHDDLGSQIHSPGKQKQQSHEQDGEATTTVSVGATTRRHKHTPSTGSAVTTIAEGMEDEEGGAGELRDVETVNEDLVASHGPGPSISLEREDTGAHPQNQGLLSESLLGAHGLGRLDLSAQSLPELRAPEDPTPLASQTGGDPMASLVAANTGPMYGDGQEGNHEIEDKMAGLTVEDAKFEGNGKAEGTANASTKDAEKDSVMEKPSKLVMKESQDANVGEAERETSIQQGAPLALEA